MFITTRTFIASLLLLLIPGTVVAQVTDCVTTWQSMRSELRSIVSPLREPKYELKLLARTTAEANKAGQPTGLPQGTVEHFSMERLPTRIVLVLGGLQASNAGANQFAVAIDESLRLDDSKRVAVFEYPNDGSMQESGEVLRHLLLKVQTASPQTKVSIVAHSMGGLIARCAIETDKQVGCVDQLVMICPPNHGSVWAQYSDALEFVDALDRLGQKDSNLGSVVLNLIDDGLGEACDPRLGVFDGYESMRTRLWSSIHDLRWHERTNLAYSSTGCIHPFAERQGSTKPSRCTVREEWQRGIRSGTDAGRGIDAKR
jgi:pimeloyl-ACP methyl ester carboxylesterase